MLVEIHLPFVERDQAVAIEVKVFETRYVRRRSIGVQQQVLPDVLIELSPPPPQKKTDKRERKTKKSGTRPKRGSVCFTVNAVTQKTLDFAFLFLAERMNEKTRMLSR